MWVAVAMATARPNRGRADVIEKENQALSHRFGDAGQRNDGQRNPNAVGG